MTDTAGKDERMPTDEEKADRIISEFMVQMIATSITMSRTYASLLQEPLRTRALKQIDTFEDKFKAGP